MSNHGATTEEECAVCFYATRTRTHPCRHVVCIECQVRWGRFSCPVCRGAMAPSLNEKTTDAADDGPGPPIVLLRTPIDGHAGICVRLHRRGVRVVEICPLDSAWDAGVRTGDVITHMNGLAIRDPHVAVSVIEAMRGVELHLAIRRRPLARCLP